MASQWEVVGKPASKKTKIPPKTLTKADKKAFAERLQQQEALSRVRGPVTDNQNAYSAFLEAENRDRIRQDRMERPVPPVSNGSNMNGAPQKKPNKPKKPEKRPPVSLESALAQITVKDLDELLVKVQMTFPDSPLLWLKDLASFLNIKLHDVPETDPLFEKHPANYPLCQVSKPIVAKIRKVIDSVNFGVLELFFEHCINSMIADMGKNVSTYGYRIFIQVLAHNNPDIIQSKLSRYLELIKTNQNRQLRCLSIMWAVGQPGVKSLSCGLRIWIDIMFPLLAIRPLASYAVKYLENIFTWHKDLHSTYGAITFRDFFPIFDVIYAGSGSLPHQLQKRLMLVYTKVKMVAFTDKQDTTLRNFFPSFLARSSPHAAEPMKAELLNCLTACLAHDKHCFSLWRQMYTRHFKQSGFLLQYLAHDFNRQAMKVDKKILIDTVKTFNVTNEDLATQKKTNFDGYSECQSACKTILLESNRIIFPWKTVFLLLVLLLASLVGYDVYTNQGRFHGCMTHQYLDRSGTLAFCQQLKLRIVEYCSLVYAWSERNVPHYYSRTVSVLGPYLVLLWQKTLQLCDFILSVTAPLRSWLYVKLTLLSAWLQSNVPVWYAALVEYVRPGLSLCGHYLTLAWYQAQTHAMLIHTWVLNNILIGHLSPDNLHRLARESLLIVRQYWTQLVTWCGNMLTQLTS